MKFDFFTYSIPTNKREMLADFYAISLCLKMPIKENNLNHYRFENVGEEIEQIAEIVIEKISQELQRAMVFACASELYHFRDNKYYGDMELYWKFAHGFGSRKITKNKKEEEFRIIRYNYALSIFKTDKAIMEFALEAFNQHWETQYGGKNWVKIAEAYFSLFNSKTIEDKMVYIDHVIDLEHNNGTFFNKLLSYKNSGFEYIQEFLHYKSKVDNPWYLYGFCSESINKILSFCLNHYGYGSFESFISSIDTYSFTTKESIRSYFLKHYPINIDWIIDNIDKINDSVIFGVYDLMPDLLKKQLSYTQLIKIIQYGKSKNFEFSNYDYLLSRQKNMKLKLIPKKSSLSRYFSVLNLTAKEIEKCYSKKTSAGICNTQKLSESFIRKHKNTICFGNLLYNPKISSSIIVKFLDEIAADVNLSYLFECKNLLRNRKLMIKIINENYKKKNFFGSYCGNFKYDLKTIKKIKNYIPLSYLFCQKQSQKIISYLIDYICKHENNLDLDQLIKLNNIPESYFDKLIYYNITNMKYIVRYQKLSKEFIEKHKNIIEWNDLLLNKKTSKKILNYFEEYKAISSYNKIITQKESDMFRGDDFDYFVSRNIASEDLIRENLKKYINIDFIKSQRLSDNFILECIENYPNSVNWLSISQFQFLSEDFIEKNKSRLFLSVIKKRRQKIESA